MISVGVVGASGYGGLELARLLLGHPRVALSHLFGQASAGKSVDAMHPALRNMCSMTIEEFSASALKGLDILFLSLPSGESMAVVPEALGAGCRVVDLGGDFRLPDVTTYIKYYGHEHAAPTLLQNAVYGLSEWNAEAVKGAQLVANPGCYPTSILLPLLPVLKAGFVDERHIAITSYSGTSGAGKSASPNMMFSEVNENVRAYKVGTHQHIPEIDTYLKAFSLRQPRFTFVPHLLPSTRGIYTTIHASVVPGVNERMIAETLEEAYGSSPFVRLSRGQAPEMQYVQQTNFCDIGWALDEAASQLIILSTLDNLGKGAAGQAVQNMNIMLGLPQTEGLLPCYKKN